ncbi:hypothetical protein [Streptantibioticus silvisoli]|uniref:Uncharacterized protein n=1 Tax=Streptantibioticus silvisoli TaxID=2705255 RepID=A0ABT6W1F7_9ACTN|nr:hypothetical protein [Streptantibioticus silvisoli]MDI5963782.1 hypothetical protein [Streptantibioticus silvisoli]
MTVEIQVRIARTMDGDDLRAVRRLIEAEYAVDCALTPVESDSPTLGVSHDLLTFFLSTSGTYAVNAVLDQVRSWLHERSQRYGTPPETDARAVGRAENAPDAPDAPASNAPAPAPRSAPAAPSAPVARSAPAAPATRSTPAAEPPAARTAGSPAGDD